MIDMRRRFRSVFAAPVLHEDELILLDSGVDQLVDQWVEDDGRSRKIRYVTVHEE